MILEAVIAAVDRYRERAQSQAQLACDIQHLREVARMLFEDKPDKTKAVEAVNDIAAKRLARMDTDARTLLDSALPMASATEHRDRGDLLRWLMLVNRPGRFPYTQGINDPDESNDRCRDAQNRSRMLRGMPPVELSDIDPAPQLAAALAEGWAWLAASAQCDQDTGSTDIEARASQVAIEFTEYRSARHHALARAARRLWAVSLRDHFGIRGDGSKLLLIASVASDPIGDGWREIGDPLTDQAEDELLAALRTLVTASAAG